MMPRLSHQRMPTRERSGWGAVAATSIVVTGGPPPIMDESAMAASPGSCVSSGGCTGRSNRANAAQTQPGDRFSRDHLGHITPAAWAFFACRRAHLDHHFVAAPGFEADARGDEPHRQFLAQLR